MDKWGFLGLFVLLLGVLVFLFFPTYQRPSRRAANEVCAIGMLRETSRAQEQFRALEKATLPDPKDPQKQIGRYALDFEELTRSGLVGPDFFSRIHKARAERNGYIFELKTAKDGLRYEVVAYPMSPEDGRRSFWISEADTITFSTNPKVRAGAGSPKVD